MSLKSIILMFVIGDKKSILISLVMLLVFSNIDIKAQNCDINIDTGIPVCRNVSFELSVEECENCTYEWKKDGKIVGGPTSAILVQIDDQSLFTVSVTDEVTGLDCISDPYLVTTRPEILIELEQLQLTCTNGDLDNGNIAKVRATATGEFEPDEYHYIWDVKPIQIAPGDSTIALGLKAHQNYSITVKDNHGCYEQDTIWTEAYDNPEVELYADPDTAFVQKPHIEFSFVNLSADSIPLYNISWDFNDDNDTANSYLPNPIHSFYLNDIEIGKGGKEYMIVFTAENNFGCDTTFAHTVSVIPMQLSIPNVFTPNGDGVNDKFVITEPSANSGGEGGEGLKSDLVDGFYVPNHYYENTNLVVFNRHGRVIFRDDDYQNDWDGGNLSEGVYYYVLKASGPRGEEVYKGSVSIIRGGSY